MNKLSALVAAASLSMVPFVSALEEATGEGPAPAAEPTTETAAPAVAEGTVHDPTKVEELRPMVGQTLTIRGVIVDFGESRDGNVRYLNYTKNYRESVALVFFRKEAAFPSDVLRSYVGKLVETTGVLSEHKGNLQIAVDSIESLKVSEPPADAAGEKTPG